MPQNLPSTALASVARARLARQSWPLETIPEAMTRATDLRPVLAELEASGISSTRAIVHALNDVYRQSAGEWEHLNKMGVRSSAVRRGRILRPVRGLGDLGNDDIQADGRRLR